ncbi:MAG: putative DNA binding domain-containing protein [Methylococcaceae bacterium]|nr:putative DNA binding domain-containing protein [Methylococcaceae bacterium]
MNSSTNRTLEYLNGLLRELIALPYETEWVEFKQNNNQPEKVGEYISALSNSAALCGKANAYLIWGIDDKTHNVVGTKFSPSTEKKGEQELESWLLNLLTPRIHFHFYALDIDEKQVVILEIARAARNPVQFQGIEFIRVGSYKKKLKDYPEKERALWRVFDETPFEEMVALERITDEDVLKLLDYPAYFDLLGLALPENRQGIINRLKDDNLIVPCDAGGWNITNLAAILFAKQLADFKNLKRKAIRVIVYKGNNRIDTTREQEGKKGYACGFEGVIDFINNLLPRNEVINDALRKDVPMYPELAVRELVANALIHQDFFAKGTGPMVEIFSDRMEITNPGLPLVDTNRFLDSPPKSRNESVASMMRRIGVCEERGSGIDKVVFQTEFYQLPAPSFEVIDEHTRSVLFAHKPFNDMDNEDRIRACYLHCCLKWVERKPMNNASVRERFGIEEQNKALASRIIKQTIDSKLIKPYDADAGVRNRRYIPSWG